MNDKQLHDLLAPLGDSITSPADLLGGRKPSILFRPMVRLVGHLLSGDPERILSKRSMAVRRLLHPILMLVAPLFLERKQVFESKNALLGIDAPDAPLALPREPVIWCPTHGFKDDVVATILASRHAYILFGSLPAFFNTFDGVSAYINGSVMCNRKVKASKQASFDGAIQVLRMGTDILMYPEGVWNKHPDKLILDLWPGAYRMAKETGCRIVPVIHYLRDAHEKYRGNVIHTVVADPISMEGLTEQEGLALLRDTMATWYYLMMEKYGRSTRAEILSGFGTADDAWESYIAMHTGAIPYYDRDIELTADYRPRHIVRPEDVFRPIAAIETITAANAHHVRHARQLVAREERRDFQRRY